MKKQYEEECDVCGGQLVYEIQMVPGDEIEDALAVVDYDNSCACPGDWDDETTFEMESNAATNWIGEQLDATKSSN